MKEEKVKKMKQIWDYCFICQKRSGSWYYDCSPNKVWGRHGNGKPIYSHKYREYKSWKHNRKTQWKTKD
jgi:hypothetical protein